MKLARALCLAWCLGAGAGGCESDLDRSLDGLRCTTDWRCVEGYSCDPASMLCVRNGLSDAGGASSGAGAGGSAASMGGAGAGGAGVGGNGGHAGDGGNAGHGGNAGNAGNGGLLAGQGSQAGAAAVDPDAGLDDADGGDACVPATVYRDRDGDGFGDDDDSGVGCPGNGWVLDGTDCRDDIPEVNPGQTAFFRTGYAVPGGSVSFDYNCSTIEEPSPSNDIDAVPDCAVLVAGLNCNGNGFLPVQPLRQGTGVESRCGSVTLRECDDEGLLTSCNTIDEPVQVDEAFVCH